MFSVFSLEIEDSFNKSIKIRQEILENKIKDKQHREKLEEQDHGSEKDEAADDTAKSNVLVKLGELAYNIWKG